MQRSHKSRSARNLLKKRGKKRGRKHSRAWSRTSRYLRKPQPDRLRLTEVTNLIAADQMATRIGHPLTAFVTIRWSLTEQGEQDINRRWSLLLNSFRIWTTRRRIEWTMVGVHENPPATEPSFNSHLLVHLPPRLHKEAAAWLKKQLGGSPDAIHIRPRCCPGWSGDRTLTYMCKGTDWATAKRFHLAGKHGWKHDQGTVPFRRCTTSRNIGATARRNFRGKFLTMPRARKAADERE